ncbi:MAG: hypothetical protein IT533_03200 [Hyphomicrobiales bacterium]|jgi:hypothetical protein|nr:hypothetical protein [Hyphomicrobiales bacterium]
MRRSFSLIAAALLGTIMAGATAANAGDRIPRECEDSGILSRISAKFRHQVRNVPNLPDVSIEEFRRIHQHRYLPYAEDHPIARRYCGATALLSDGRKKDVWYLIEDGMGLAGIGQNVEFCVAGFDRWMVYNGRCRVLW